MRLLCWTAVLLGGCFHDLDRDFRADMPRADLALNESGSPLHDLSPPDQAPPADGPAVLDVLAGQDGAPGLITGGVNAGCKQSGWPVTEVINGQPQSRWPVVCPLPKPGTTTRYALAPLQFLELENTNKAAVRLDRVKATATTITSQYVKACVFLGEKTPAQSLSKPGVGEIGCVARAPDVDFPRAIEWKAGTTVKGALVEPLTPVFVDTQPHQVRVDLEVTLGPDTSDGALVLRSPLAAVGVACGSQPSDVEWYAPAGETWTLHGATVFTISTFDPTLTLDSGALYLVGSSGYKNLLRDKMTSQGTYAFLAPAKLTDTDGFRVEAAKSCASGTWSYAAYSYIIVN